MINCLALRITCAVAAAAISCTLYGCTKSDEHKENVISTENVSLNETQDVVAVINGEEIPADEYRYYIYYVGSGKMASMQANAVSAEDFDWNQKTADGQNLSDVIKEEAFDLMTGEVISTQKAKENGFALTDDEINAANDSIDNAVEQGGREYVQSSIASMGIESLEFYKQKVQDMALMQKIADDAVLNTNKYVTDVKLLKEYKQPSRVTAQHVLIKKDSEKYPDPFLAAGEVLAKAKAGENFEALMKTYNEDPGESEAGYTFGPGEMVEPFEAAAFALDYDEISEIVETQYGYHIIKRKYGISELAALWKSEAEIERKDDVIKKFKTDEIMKSCEAARKRAAEELNKINQNMNGTKEGK